MAICFCYELHGQVGQVMILAQPGFSDLLSIATRLPVTASRRLSMNGLSLRGRNMAEPSTAQPLGIASKFCMAPRPSNHDRVVSVSVCAISNLRVLAVLAHTHTHKLPGSLGFILHFFTCIYTVPFHATGTTLAARRANSSITKRKAQMPYPFRPKPKGKKTLVTSYKTK